MKKLLILFFISITKLAVAQDFVALAQQSLPSVVSITSKIDGKEVVGSGFIIDETGLIVTNNHVVDGALSIDVLINEKQSFKAKIKGKDDVLDIAIIKVDPFELLAFVEFANSDDIQVGQWLMAVGNPFGLGNSVSVGVVSAKSRDIQSSPYDDFIQTDAAINMGNSGGPLFDLDGKVVGMTTAMFSQDAKNSGVGFALPSNQIKWVVAELKKNGKIERGWIGLKIMPLVDGIKISEVQENSPVFNAGLKVGDKLLQINGVDIKNPRELSKAIATTAIGKYVKIKTDKGVFDVLVSQRTAFIKPLEDIKSCYALDMEINAKDLSIISVKNDSDAFIKGLKKGDKLQAFDNKPMITCQDISSYLLEAKRFEKQTVMTKITTQQQNTHFVELKI